jgi:hypothetical protein
MFTWRSRASAATVHTSIVIAAPINFVVSIAAPSLHRIDIEDGMVQEARFQRQGPRLRAAAIVFLTKRARVIASRQEDWMTKSKKPPLTNVPSCGVCGTPLVIFCPACRGRQGGKSKSPKKMKAARQSMEKARKKLERIRRG